MRSQYTSAPRAGDKPLRRPSGGADATTVTGLRHLVAPADEILSRDGLIAEIDRMVQASGDTASPKLRQQVVALLAERLKEGREFVRAHLLASPNSGLRVARSFAYVTDVIVTGVHAFCSDHLHPRPIRTKGEEMAIVAVGGYGRGEMAPFSDVDLLFLTPYKQTPWGESAIEDMLYILWDLKLKVGQSSRSISDCLRYGRDDFTVRTALLEKRFICGDRAPFEQLDHKLWSELFSKTGSEFVEAKLDERDQRHKRHGGSRLVLEPNIKEGKGGLRDLQTLHWVSKYIYHTGSAWDLVDMGVYERDEVRTFADASKYIWSIRCHLHDLSGRAQEVLTFDRQIEIAQRMGFDDPGEEDVYRRRGVERFMQTYFRHAKNVGDLTRIFAAALEAQHAKRQPTLSRFFGSLNLRSEDGSEPFAVRGGRLTVRDENVFREDPLNILRLFKQGAKLDARIHPAALRTVTQNLDLIDEDFRRDPRANALFMEMLTDPKNSAVLLRRMNETDVLGRFLPEFDRIVSMMQFNMYHHYTVDEHTIQTIRVLNQIESGAVIEDLPVASEIVKQGINRRVLYTALLLHDIGKGQERDHSELGAEIAEEVCPRLGLDEGETEMIVWLVRHHLLMSDTAQKRDIADPTTVREFANTVQIPERLRKLLVLTVCDIRGVGPGVWNNWKAQLLRHLYWDTRNMLTGNAEASRSNRIERAQAALTEHLADWPGVERALELARHYPHYWLGLATETQVQFAEMAREVTEAVNIRFTSDEDRDATVALLYMQDHPGLFSRMAGAFALAGANVVDARTYTTTDGMARSSFWIQDADGQPFEEARLPRLKRTIERTLAGDVIVREGLEEKARHRVERPFRVPTRVKFDNNASDLYTVIEVDARDRLGLLHDLTRTLSAMNINIFCAIIATYGEQAVDVFYVRDLFGLKITSAPKQAQIEKRIVAALDAASKDRQH